MIPSLDQIGGKIPGLVLKSLPVFFISACLAATSAIGQCVNSIGPNNPFSARDQPFSGSNFAFLNPANVLVSDGSSTSSTALLTLLMLSGKTDYLMATHFNMGLPVTATVCGISVSVQKSASNILGLVSTVQDYQVYLLKNGIPVGTNKASPAAWTSASSWYSYGALGDNWGTSWSVSEINAANFGVAISATMTGLVTLAPSALIDNIRLTVYYDNSSLLGLAIPDFYLNTQGDSAVQLHWMMASGHLASYYLVQRSSDGAAWETLDSLLYNPLTSMTPSLEFQDAHPLEGKSYYRIALSDPEKGLQFSRVASAVLPISPIQVVYPNPASRFVMVRNPGSNPGVRVCDASGRYFPVQVMRLDARTLWVGLESLQPGIYFLSVQGRMYTVLKK